MKAKSLKGNSLPEIQSALNDAIDSNFKPTLAIVFLSVTQDRKAIVKLLDKENLQIFGVTTNGEFIDEETEKESTAIMLLDIDSTAFKIYLEEYPDKTFRNATIKIGNKAKELFEKPAFILGISHPAADGEEVLRGFQEVIGNNVNVFGGGAGDDYGFIETFVFTNSQESNNGVLALTIDESKVKMSGVATCGWKAVGTEKTVTKSEGNHVYTIDNEPAAEITARYGGLEISPDKPETLMEMAGNFPLQLQRDDGEPIMRPGLVVDWDDYSFYTSGKVPQGSKVRFSIPPDWDVMQKVVDGVENLKESEMPEADAVIVFSCAGRILSFGPMMTDEIEGIKNVWNVPMIGMFSTSELGRMKGGNLEMHNITTCCVALKAL